MYDELVKRLRSEAECHDNYPEDSALMREAADAIEELIAALTASNTVIANSKPHWISVEERLPEDRQSVLVHRDDGGIFIFEYFTTSPTDECWIDDYLNVYSAYSVTHWMPLPKPPKEEV